jgi:hypothetical protein
VILFKIVAIPFYAHLIALDIRIREKRILDYSVHLFVRWLFLVVRRRPAPRRVYRLYRQFCCLGYAWNQSGKDIGSKIVTSNSTYACGIAFR